MKRILLLIVLAVFTMNGIKAQTPITEAIDFTATDVHGHTWNLFDLLDSGQYVVIDFFFCTCGPCQIAAPKINESFVYFGCNSGDVNYFAIDTGDDDAACILFDETYGVEYPTISGIEGGGNQICDDYQIPAYPTVILIAPDRTILEQDIWPIPTAQTIIDALESHGLEAHDCPPPVGIIEAPAKIAAITSVYPNPASSSIHIETSAEESMNVNIEIFNAMGIEAFKSRSLTLESGENTIEFSVADLPAGTYIVRLRKSNEVLDVSRISISR